MRCAPALLLLAMSAMPAADDAVPLDDVGTVDEHEWVMAASRRRQRLADAPAATVVLDAADLRSTGAVTLPDRLRYVPGVDVYQARNGQYDVGLRGWNALLNNRMLVVVNGQEYRQEEFGAVTWLGPIFTSDIARVEILKGPASVTYGANAFGGVVAVMERPVSNRVQGDFVATYGDHGRREIDATVAGPVAPRVDAKVSAGLMGLDDLDGTSAGAEHVASARTGSTGAADLRCRRLRGVLGVAVAEQVRIELEARSTGLTTWELVDDLDTGSNATSSIYRDGRVRVLSPWCEATYERHEADKTYQGQKTVYIPQEDYRYIQGGLADVSDTWRVLSHVHAGPHEVTAGVEFRQWRSRSNLWGSGTFADRASWSAVQTVDRAAILEDQWRVVPWAALTAGARVDGDSQAGANTSPRVALNMTPAAGHTVRASYSRGYRLPTPIETFLQEFYFSADPRLQAERIDALEAGWRWSSPSDGSEAGVQLFGSRADHLIWRMPLSSEDMLTHWVTWLNGGNPDLTRQPGPFFRYQNLDNPAWLGGVEASARTRLPDTPCAWWGNATWQALHYRDAVRFHSNGFIDPGSGQRLFAFDQDLGHAPDAPPTWKATTGVDATAGGWTGGIALRAVSGREVFSIANSDPMLGVIRTQRVAGYAAVDLTLGREVRWWNVNGWVRMAVMDIAGTEHAESWQTDAAYLRTYHEDQSASRVGRTMSLQGGASF